jgi:hypothetical protein
MAELIVNFCNATEFRFKSRMYYFVLERKVEVKIQFSIVNRFVPR